MSIEAEVRIMFVVGVVVVLAAELVIGAVFRKTPSIRKAMLGHAVCLLLVFACGFYMFNAPKTPDGGLYNGSGLLAITGVLWFTAEYILIRALISKKN